MATALETLDQWGGVVKASLGRIFHHLEQVATTGRLREVADAPTSEAIRSKAAGSAAPRSVGEVSEEALKILHWRERTSHSRNFVHPSPVSPLCLMGDMLAAAANPMASMWESSSGPTSVEVGLIDWFKDQLGLPEVGGGVFASGGSMASMMAYHAARHYYIQEHNWDRATVYVSDLAYEHQMERLRFIGIQREQVTVVDTDAQNRMDPDDLETKMFEDCENDFIPFLVIASAGNPTYLGNNDRILRISKICKGWGVWLHVDGEYAAPIALCPELKYLLRGIDKANSISLDASNWLKQDYGCGILLVDDKWQLARCYGDKAVMKQEASASGFSRKKDYIQDHKQPNMSFFEPDATRPARAMKLSFMLKVLGHDQIQNDITGGFALAHTAVNELVELEWTILMDQMGFVVFRYEPAHTTRRKIQTLNRSIVQRAAAEDVALMASVTLRSQVCIRMIIVNPSLTEEGMVETIHEIDRIARGIDLSQLEDGPSEDSEDDEDRDNQADEDTSDPDSDY